jgi:hypothetical protein
MAQRLNRGIDAPATPVRTDVPVWSVGASAPLGEGMGSMSEQITEKPILFNAAMVRAILAGNKTQTRRIVKITSRTPGLAACLLPIDPTWARSKTAVKLCPYGKPGDRLWVRETFYGWRPRIYFSRGVSEGPYQAIYKADWGLFINGVKWSPSIHMPRWASRITLEITDVRVQRLQEISEEDAKAEGICEFEGKPGVFDGGGPAMGLSACTAFMRLWDSINGNGAWNANPWVWAVSFRMLS